MLTFRFFFFRFSRSEPTRVSRIIPGTAIRRRHAPVTPQPPTPPPQNSCRVMDRLSRPTTVPSPVPSFRVLLRPRALLRRRRHHRRLRRLAFRSRAPRSLARISVASSRLRARLLALLLVLRSLRSRVRRRAVIGRLRRRGRLVVRRGPARRRALARVQACRRRRRRHRGRGRRPPVHAAANRSCASRRNRAGPRGNRYRSS